MFIVMTGDRLYTHAHCRRCRLITADVWTLGSALSENSHVFKHCCFMTFMPMQSA